MTDLLSGGAVGAGMGELVKYAIQRIKSGLQLGSTLKTSIETLNVLALHVEKMKGYNDSLDRPKEEIERLETLLREWEDIVTKSKKLTWKNIWSFPSYQSKLQKQHQKLERHSSVNVQLENKYDLMKLRANVDEISKILMRMVNSGQFDGKQIRGLYGAAEEPEFIGMDEPLNNLKFELMKDGVSVLVLTGSEFELTTLDNMLCRDPQIRGKFGRNIFYVRVSSTPNLKNIVQTIIDSCGYWVPEFQNEDAIDTLGLLFREIGFPILLVLDDVLPGFEDLVEKFKFQLPDYKILYTETKPFSTPSHSSSNNFVAQDGGKNDMLKDIVLWRRKKLSTIVLTVATSTWMLMEVYLFNFLTLISWLTIFVVTSIFLYSNMLTLFGKEPPNLLRLELKEETTVRMAKTVRAWIEKSIRWLFVVSIKKDWPLFVGVMAMLLVISYVGSCMDFLTFTFIGILAGMTLPYIKNEDKIKRCM